jgi:hypothetical protein
MRERMERDPWDDEARQLHNEIEAVRATHERDEREQKELLARLSELVVKHEAHFLGDEKTAGLLEFRRVIERRLENQRRWMWALVTGFVALASARLNDLLKLLWK